MEKGKLEVESRVTISREHVEKVLKKELALPEHAKMMIAIEMKGSVDQGNYEELLTFVSFKWTEEHKEIGSINWEENMK